MARYDISVIVPTLNEEAALPALLRDLQDQVDVSFEVLVADGGSDDRTVELAREFTCVRVLTCDRGRGRQMNDAARAARGAYLFFLHADTRLTSDAFLRLARDALDAARQAAGHDRVAGHCQLEFDRRDRRRHQVAFRYAEEKMAFDRPHVVNGDQGLLLTPGFFDTVGGFDESLGFLEDQRIAADIRRHGRWVQLPGTLRTSARRFEAAGFYRLYILMAMLMGLYWAGASVFFERLPDVYSQQRDLGMGKLLMTPFFREIRAMFRVDYGLRGTPRLVVKIGRFMRSHSWQMFYFVDIWLRPVLGPRRYPFLTMHDTVFVKLTNFAVFDLLAGVLAVVWFLGILAPVYALLDRRALGEQARAARVHQA
ncbi:MAG: TIGR04283 family arsenosugar biosynthesis glycosyltransferase [Acidobacteria bacterium]|nr:TIGR04283 family arsenosugar biosynthesis glycosyltransferase [Acidobacteriota bacterium]